MEPSGPVQACDESASPVLYITTNSDYFNVQQCVHCAIRAECLNVVYVLHENLRLTSISPWNMLLTLLNVTYIAFGNNYET